LFGSLQFWNWLLFVVCLLVLDILLIQGFNRIEKSRLVFSLIYSPPH